MKKLLGSLLLLLIAGAVVVAFMYSRINEPYRGYGAAEQFVDIPQGTGSLGIGERLVVRRALFATCRRFASRCG